MIEAITFDFGNTLVPVSRAGLAGVVAETAAAIAERLGPFSAAAVLDAWAEERDRQFREEVPQLREVDLGQRVVRVLARMRGKRAPRSDERWDDAAAAALSSADEVEWAVDRYSGAFVETMPPEPGAGELLARLALGYRLAILSNWPLATTLDRYAEAHGWSAHLSAIVVSQRVGTIKPHPLMFETARAALGGPAPGRILHVGDDWAADVVGAKRAGWRVAWLNGRPVDSPLPGSERAFGVDPDLQLARLAELEAALAGLAEGSMATPRETHDRR